ncbi:MAG: flagellar hook protein FlgE [Gemmobacter sp.]
MTISSSLNAGVAGLNANATRLAAIADNIANSATHGYKRSSVDFHALVNAPTSSPRFTAGGVRATSLRMIDERGPLISSDNPTDLAVNGRGFLPVAALESIGRGGPLPMSLVTTGSFRLDAEGLLRTESGQVLLGWSALPDGSFAPQPRDTTAGLEPVRVSVSQFTANPTTAVSVAVNLPADATRAGASGDPLELPVQYFGNLGTTEALVFRFAPTVPAAGSSNQWTLTIEDSTSGSTVGEYVLTFDDSQAAGGTLASVTTTSGGPYDPVTGRMDLTLGSGTLSLDIGVPGQRNGMSQLSASFAPVSISRDGAPVASIVGLEVDGKGVLHALYDQGFSRPLYRIPLVDVPNPNGLIALNNQAYRVSPASGAFYLWDAGDGPTGSVAGFAREESATDVARELTHLIQTQRAYSSNAKVIQTVDDMLQETTNIKR